MLGSWCQNAVGPPAVTYPRNAWDNGDGRARRVKILPLRAVLWGRAGTGLRPARASHWTYKKPQQRSEVWYQAVADQRTEVSMETRGAGSMGPGREGALGAQRHGCLAGQLLIKDQFSQSHSLLGQTRKLRPVWARSPNSGLA